MTLSAIEYLYRPMYRPAHNSAFPPDVTWDYVEAPANDAVKGTKTMEMVELYRQSAPIQQKVEKGFHDLDSLIQQVDTGLQEEEFRKLLERYDLSGPIN